MIHLSSTISLGEAIDAVSTKPNSAFYIMIAIIVLIYITIVTILTIREYRWSPGARSMEDVRFIATMLFIASFIPAIIGYGVIAITYVPHLKQQRDTVAIEHIEDNIDGTVKAIGHYRTSQDDPNWVRQASYRIQADILFDDTTYPEELIMVYDETHDIMIPVDPNALAELPLIEGSQLSVIQQQSAEQSTDEKVNEDGTTE